MGDCAWGLKCGTAMEGGKCGVTKRGQEGVMDRIIKVASLGERWMRGSLIPCGMDQRRTSLADAGLECTWVIASRWDVRWQRGVRGGRVWERASAVGWVRSTNGISAEVGMDDAESGSTLWKE